MLTDFGVATLDGDPALTATGMLLGSPAYMAPERALGAPTGPASDLWSLGATLFAAVEGRPPYDRPTSIATLSALVTEDPPAPRNADILTPLIVGLLQRDPGRRFDAATARTLLADAMIEAAVEPTVVIAAPPTLSAPPGRRPRSPRFMSVTGTALAIALGLNVVASIVVARWAWRRRRRWAL